MARLTAKARAALPDRAFAIPSKREYPIEDRTHAADAKGRVTQHGTPAEKRQVRGAVARKYPSLGKKR